MNDYIVNPWLFYLMDLLGWVDRLTPPLIVLSTIVLTMLIIVLFLGHDDDTYRPFIPLCKRWLRILAFVIGLMTLINFALPSSDTVLKMVIASQVTHTNLDKAKDGAKELVDYIIEKAESLSNKKK